MWLWRIWSATSAGVHETLGLSSVVKILQRIQETPVQGSVQPGNQVLTVQRNLPKILRACMNAHLNPTQEVEAGMTAYP